MHWAVPMRLYQSGLLYAPNFKSINAIAVILEKIYRTVAGLAVVIYLAYYKACQVQF